MCPGLAVCAPCGSPDSSPACRSRPADRAAHAAGAADAARPARLPRDLPRRGDRRVAATPAAAAVRPRRRAAARGVPAPPMGRAPPPRRARPASRAISLDGETGAWLRPPPLRPFGRGDVIALLERDVSLWRRDGWGPWLVHDDQAQAL